MSSKHIQIPYNVIAQSEQDINYPADSLYANTMNAPTPITLDLYLNHSKIDEKVIEPNYEINLENINIDEVKIKTTQENNTFQFVNTLNIPAGITGTIYNIYNNNGFIYFYTSTGIFQTDLSLNIKNSYLFSSLGASYTSLDGNSWQTVVFDESGNIYTLVYNTSTDKAYILKLNSNLTEIKISGAIALSSESIITLFNNSLYIYDTTNLYNVSLNLTVLNITSINTGGAYSFSFNNEFLFVMTSSTVLYQINILTGQTIGSFTFSADSYYKRFSINYSASLQSYYITLFNDTSLNIYLLNSSSISNFNANNSFLSIGSGLLNNIYTDEKYGYLVLLCSNGLYIIDSNLKIIYSNLNSVSNIGLYVKYLTISDTNIIEYTGSSILEYKYNITPALSNPLYSDYFNLILSCGCA